MNNRTKRNWRLPTRLLGLALLVLGLFGLLVPLLLGGSLFGLGAALAVGVVSFAAIRLLGSWGLH